MSEQLFLPMSLPPTMACLGWRCVSAPEASERWEHESGAVVEIELSPVRRTRRDRGEWRPLDRFHEAFR